MTEASTLTLVVPFVADRLMNADSLCVAVLLSAVCVFDDEALLVMWKVFVLLGVGGGVIVLVTVTLA